MPRPVQVPAKGETMRRQTKRFAVLAAVLLSGVVIGLKPAPAADEKSLYERLGERPAIRAVVDGMVDKIASDDRVAWRFKNTDFSTYKPTFVDFVCYATGGPCQYKGLGMPDAHGRMGISHEEFDITIGHILDVLDGLGVPPREKAELVMLVGTLRGQVVEQ